GHAIGAGGNADASEKTFVYIWFCRSQKRQHVIPFDCGKAPAEKRDFRRSRIGFSAFYGNFASAAHIVRRGRFLRAGNGPLIAETALLFTAEMRHKQRDVDMLQIPISSSASLAAFCSAFFLLPPTPRPMTLLFKCTSTVKHLSWSGPVSETSTYSSVSPWFFSTTSCNIVL